MLHKLENRAAVEYSSVGMKLWLGWVGLSVAVGFAYFLVAQLGLALLTTVERVAVFWPASGIAVGILIALGAWARGPVAAGVIAATVAANLLADRGVWSALAFGLCNAAEALLAMWLIERCFGPVFNLDTVRRVGGFFAAAIVATAVAALAAAGAMKLFGPSTAAFLDVWEVWFASDVLGVVTVAPLVVGIAASLRDAPSWRELLEGALAVGAVAVVNGAALALLVGPRSLMAPALFLIPLLFWLASRCRPVFAAAAAFTVAAAIVWTTVHGFGRYGDPTLAIEDRVLAAQTAMLMISLAALALAALFAERRRSEAVLGQSESEMRELLRALADRNAQFSLAEESALVGSFAYDVGTEMLQISDGYAAIHGFLNETKGIPRSRWLAVVHPEDRARVDELRSRAFNTRSPEYNFDFRIVRPGGEVRWIEGRAFVAYRDDGSPQRVAGVNIDVTQRKRAEAAVEESRARYRALYDDNPSMYFTVDVAGTVLSVNEFGAQQLGYRPAELVGRSVLEVVHEGDHEVARRWLASCAQNAGTIATREMRKVRRDGSTMWVRKVARAVQGVGGQVLVVVCEDITERKKAELTLAERNIQLALAGKAALVGSYAYDTDTEIMQISEGYAVIHGFPEGTTEIRRSECLAGVHPDDVERLTHLRDDALRACEHEYTLEYRVVRAGGEVRWVEARGFISFDGSGCPHRVVGVNIDVTERKQVEEQQRKLVAELDHRVKNVLATVQAVAAQTMQASSSMEQFVAALDGRIRSMGSTHELLSHRRWLGIPLAELVGRELAPYTTGSNTEIGGPEVVLSAEAAQTMAMVLHELVTNAAKYGSLSTRDGRVSVRWYPLLNGNTDPRLCIEWQETDGPPVQASERCGYGVEVIRRLLPYELEGEVDLVFATEGVRCRFSVPLSRLTGHNRGADTNEDDFTPTGQRLHG